MTNVSSGRCLARRASFAVTRAERRRGLAGIGGLCEGEGMVFRRCRQVHTFGMLFDIDVLFLDRHGLVVRAYGALPPRRLTTVVRRARTAVELPEGTLAATGTAVGDVVLVEEP